LENLKGGYHSEDLDWPSSYEHSNEPLGSIKGGEFD